MSVTTGIDPRHTALVIIDLQNDFLAPDGAYARGGAVSAAAQALPPRVAALAQALKAGGGMVVGSQFTLWPDAQGEPMVSPHLKALRPFLRRGDFALGSTGQAHVPEIAPWVDVSVCKVAYSAFFNTQLDWVLRRAGISTVAVCGIVTNGAWPARCAMRTCATTRRWCCPTDAQPSGRKCTIPRWPTWPTWPRC